MSKAIERLFQKYDSWRRRHVVLDSLALNRRGEVRKDGLILISLREQIEIFWRARSVHPWDRSLPDREKKAAFVEQSLLDTEAALFRLFRVLPGADAIDFKVLDSESDRVLIEGVVSRSDLDDLAPFAHTSIRMRLRRLGIREYLSENSVTS